MKSWKEKKLLKMLSSGVLDGRVGDSFFTSGGSAIWKTIEDGIPKVYKRGPGGKFFNGKENERYKGVLHLLDTYDTDDQKLGFLRCYGWLMKDPDVKAYSARFKQKR